MSTKLSLDAIAREQLKAASAATSGRAAETVYGGHERRLRQTLMALTAGTRMEEHESPGEATLLVVRGRVELSSGDDRWEGRSGDLLVIPEARHSLAALEDSAVLLTVAIKGS
jgi:quercetin dioxygenase-like cupin family protein